MLTTPQRAGGRSGDPVDNAARLRRCRKATFTQAPCVKVAFLQPGAGRRRRGGQISVASPVSRVTPAPAKLGRSATAARPSGPPMPAPKAAASAKSSTATRW